MARGIYNRIAVDEQIRDGARHAVREDDPTEFAAAVARALLDACVRRGGSNTEHIQDMFERLRGECSDAFEQAAYETLDDFLDEECDDEDQ